VSEHADVSVPVLVVGGGGAGMTASICLSNAGVERLLVPHSSFYRPLNYVPIFPAGSELNGCWHG
jgi:heterodisulfide reductase subunit A-like polyferredoxin